MNLIPKSFLVAASFAAMLPLQSSAHAHGSETSAMSVALPVAIVVSTGYGASVAAAGVVALPVALSVSGAVLIVKSVEASATGVLCVVERASDGARASLELTGRTAATLGVSVGSTVSVTMTASGAIIASAGEAIAFVPNALGRALTHNERL